MACAQITGYTEMCLFNMPGIKKIYITNFENVTATTQSSIGTITDIDLSDSTKFQEFVFRDNTCSIDEEGNISIENGTTYWTQTVNLTIPKRHAALRDKILVLAAGQPKLAVIVKDNNDLYWFFGLTNGAYLKSAKTGSGTKKDDANNYTLSIVAEEPTSAPEVDSAIISGIIA